MKANPSKFQAIVYVHKAKADDICFNLNDNKVEATKLAYYEFILGCVYF